MEHEHTFTHGWVRSGDVFRACECGVYDNPNVLESDFPTFTNRDSQDPFEGLTGND